MTNQKLTRTAKAKQECTVQHCTNPQLATGLCNAHYIRRKRESTPIFSQAHLDELATKFWESVEKSNESACWPFVGKRRDKDGYGQVYFGYRMLRAHRVAYVLTHGVFLESLIVRHTCDNPPCCNPSHLKLGTNADNVRDKVERNRQARGSKIRRAVLSEADVREIKIRIARKEKNKVIAQAFNVTPEVISQIKTGGSWRWI